MADSVYNVYIYTTNMKNFGKTAVNCARYACLFGSTVFITHTLDAVVMKKTPTESYVSNLEHDARHIANFVHEHPEYRDQLIAFQQSLEKKYIAIGADPEAHRRIQAEREQMRPDALKYGLLFLGTSLFYIFGETIPEYFERRRKKAHTTDMELAHD